LTHPFGGSGMRKQKRRKANALKTRQEDLQEIAALLEECYSLLRRDSPEAKSIYAATGDRLLTEQEAQVVVDAGGRIARNNNGHPYQVPDFLLYGDVLESMEYHLDMDDRTPPKH